MSEPVQVKTHEPLRVRRPSGALAAVVALAFVALMLLARVAWVHHQDGEWRLTPSAVPPRLCVLDHPYSLHGLVDRFPEGLEPWRSTPGGGEVFIGNTDDVLNALYVYAVHNGKTFEYFLSGSPSARC
jgi:hypothetical protein